jgi:predicted HicB family RNase H-like nuclease
MAVDEKRLNADIPTNLHKRLSVLAAKKGKRLKPLIIEALELLLEKYEQEDSRA